MTRKYAYSALAVVFAAVLAAGMVIGTPGMVLADNEGTGYGTIDSSHSSEPGNLLEQSEAAEIREPMETGAIPDGSMKEEHEGWLNLDVTEQNLSPELRGRPNIQAGE